MSPVAVRLSCARKRQGGYDLRCALETVELLPLRCTTAQPADASPYRFQETLDPRRTNAIDDRPFPQLEDVPEGFVIGSFGNDLQQHRLQAVPHLLRFPDAVRFPRELPQRM